MVSEVRGTESITADDVRSNSSRQDWFGGGCRQSMSSSYTRNQKDESIYKVLEKQESIDVKVNASAKVGGLL